MVLPDTHTQRPHYNGHVAAGAWDIEPQPVITDTWRDILDIAPEYDFTATATGDSMLPLIHDGDTIAHALGHGGNTVTDIYIDFDQSKVDDANRRVLDWVLYGRR